MSVLTGGAVVLTCAMYLIRDRPQLPVGRAGAAGGDGGLRRPGQRPVQRDAAPAVDARRRPAGSPVSAAAAGLPRQRRAADADLPGIHLRHGRGARAAARARPRRALRPDGDAAGRGVVGGAGPAVAVGRPPVARPRCGGPADAACWVAIASCGRRSTRSGGATATWSTSWAPARSSGTGWRPFSRSARCWASTCTASRKRTS